MRKVSTNLWFKDNAEEAVQFYLSIFKNSKIIDVFRHTKSSAQMAGCTEGDVMSITFQLEGIVYTAFNGGSYYNPNHSISLMVQCSTQEELDFIWDKLADEGTIQQCGWLRDKYGIGWNIDFTELYEMIKNKDSGNVDKMMEALFHMKKLDLSKLKEAYQQIN